MRYVHADMNLIQMVNSISLNMGCRAWIAQVYMSNIAPGGKPFLSFKRIVRETSSEVELASFHSCSKGVVGECGLRAGCMSSCSHLCAVFPKV